MPWRSSRFPPRTAALLLTVEYPVGRSLARTTVLLAVEGEVGAMEGREAGGEEGGQGEGILRRREVERRRVRRLLCG